ncbi:MAG: aminodeoxychorismate lyase [Gammaproteobacteria bacterium]
MDFNILIRTVELQAGCNVLGLAWPGAELLGRDVERLALPGGEGIIKLMITRGDGGRGYAPQPDAGCRRVAGRYPLPALPETGMQVGRCSTRLGRNAGLAGLKHLCRLEQVLGAAEVASAGWDEGIMTDEDGRVIEATRHNLFLVRDGRVRTPRLDGCGVAGVMRALVLEWCRRSHRHCSEDRVSWDELVAADEIILTNAVRGLVPVTDLCGRPVAPGPVGAELREGLAREGVVWLGA